MNRARVTAVSCTHVPFHSSVGLDILLQTLAKLNDDKPITHFVHLGDLMDATAASVHADDPAKHTLLDEFQEAATLLSRIRAVLPDTCKLIWCHGNHDDNILRQDPRRIPHDIRPLCNWNNVSGCGDEFRRWKQLPYRMGIEGCYQLGGIIFAHGWSCGQNSDELESLKLAQICGGWAHRLIVRGHTHRPVPPTQAKRSATILLPWHYANVGHCAFDQRANYTYRLDVSRWSRAMLIAECSSGRADRIGNNSWDAQIIPLQ